MRKLYFAAVLVALAAPALAERTGCTAAITATGVCRQNSDVLWSLSVSSAADAKLQTALAKKAGWTATVICTQAMVDLSQCSAGQIVFNLPTAAAGYCYDFAVQDADGIKIVASAGDTIRQIGTVSAAAGYIQSVAQGSTLRLCSINATEWIEMSALGTWTIDS